MKPRRQPVYDPRVCHRCGGAGCARCEDSGYTRGPDHAPVPFGDLSAPQANYYALQRGRS